jgi:site-specific recombinase XerD
MPYIDESGHLFYNKHNNPLTARNLDAYFEKIWKKSGIETKYTLKDLRSRSILDMVSAAIRSGSDLPTVGAYVGIKDLRLNTYVSANTIVGDCPADLVNFQIKN